MSLGFRGRLQVQGTEIGAGKGVHVIKTAEEWDKIIGIVTRVGKDFLVQVHRPQAQIFQPQALNPSLIQVHGPQAKITKH